MNKKDGGSAFPVLDTAQTGNIHSLQCEDGGMSLRDYFAGQALAGLFKEGNNYIDEDVARRIAEQCYTVANAMLTEKEIRDNA